jgi:hypothetical protein
MAHNAEALVAVAAKLSAVEGKLGSVLAQERTLPVVPSLAGLFPGGALRRGSTVVVSPGPFPGATCLALSLLAGPSAAGSWCAVVGGRDLGLVAAAQMGTELERLAIVPSPGAHWPVLSAALLEGFDVVLLRPVGSVSPAEARKLEARARERGSVLTVLAGRWPGAADVRLCVSRGTWKGLDRGCGYLAGADVEVTAEGRGAVARPRRANVWLGGPPSALSAAPVPGPVPVPAGGDGPGLTVVPVPAPAELAG